MTQHRNFIVTAFSLTLFLTASLVYAEETANIPTYQVASAEVNTRVDDLLGRMTLEEKLAQLQGIWQRRQSIETDSGKFDPAQATTLLRHGIGQVARASENKAPIGPGKDPAAQVTFVNALQDWLLANTRLKIPALFHEEALHGHAAAGATSFPQAIALASTFDPELLQEIYAVISTEVRARGGQQVLAPVLDVARDPRWGRFEETFGEDPYLSAALGVAAVRGLQGSQTGAVAPDRVAATLKHLAGHGEPRGGLNVAPAPVGERLLREVFLLPFEAAIKLAGARAVMASFNEIDGIPSHANEKLLQQILRREWGFEGLVVSDYFAVDELRSRHGLTDSKAAAARLALTAGVDVELPDGDTYPQLKDTLQQNPSDLALIDTAVRRVLKEKFLLGLFENPYAALSPADATALVGSGPHRKLAQRAAERAVVLLKNDGVLPLDKNRLQRVAVIGPHADETLLGGYSDVPLQTLSPLAGIEQYLEGIAEVRFERGTLITRDQWPVADAARIANTRSKQRWHTDAVELATAADTEGMRERAVALAAQSDVAIVLIGGNEATAREGWSENHLGDRTSLELVGDQQALLEAIIATGTPTVVVLQHGRPLAIGRILERAPAVLEAWYLGQESGHALARILFGETNPSGKLPVSFPRSVGHIPAYYNHKPTAKRGYAFADTSALLPFGFGLSYTLFEYSQLSVDGSAARADGAATVTVAVRNSGDRFGEEVVQLYIRDPVASMTRPVQELKGFARVPLAAGASARVTFTLPVNALGFFDQQMRYVVEPGTIEVMVGSSSADIRQRGDFTIQGEAPSAVEKAFLSETRVQSLTPSRAMSTRQ